MRKIKKHWPFGVIFLLAILAARFFFHQGLFPIHDNLQILRLFEIERCFLDGQLPCRWAPDLGGGFGAPIFNYYSPLVYYIGLIPRFLGISFIDSVKILFFLGILLSGVSMYLLARELWGDLGGLISSSLYILAPYHALDIYVRGDLAEFWALSLLPLVLWSFYLLIKRETLTFFVLAILFLFALLTVHNITALLFLPVLSIWVIFWLSALKKFSFQNLRSVLFAFFFGIGLSAFFILPALFEKSLVNLSALTSGYFDFRAHYVNLSQLFFDRVWGFGISAFGPDTLSVQIGWPHWWLAVAALFAGIRQKEGFKKGLIFLMIGLFLIFVFMTHPRSVFIWEKLPLLAFVQFPWRFLGLISLVGSFLGGTISLFLIGKGRVLAFLIIGLAVLLNLNYFRPKEILSLSDSDFLQGENFRKERLGSAFDFLPKNVLVFPDTKETEAKIIQGEGVISESLQKSDYFKVNIEVFGENKANLLVPVFDFPIWEVFIDENPAVIEKNNWGLIQIAVSPGRHEVSGWFRNTKVRLLGNAVTLLSFFFLLFYLNTCAKNPKKTD